MLLHGARQRTNLGPTMGSLCVVSNIYRREDGDWKVVHHHTDLSPAMQDVLRDLKP